MTTNQLAVTEQPALRNNLIHRTEVLDTVKHLFLIPEMEVATTKMVAEYFGVDVDVIQKVYQRNKKEIDRDGVVHRTLANMRDSQYGHNVQIVKEQRKIALVFPNFTLDVPNTGLKVFPRRAILRIAMLLRDSEVAKEIRTQLLNTFEHATPQQRTAEIDNEQTLLINLGKAVAEKSFDKLLHASMEYNGYRNRYVSQMEEANANLKMLAARMVATGRHSHVRE